MDLKTIFSIIILFPILSVIIITTAIIIGGTTNDYILYEIDNVTPSLATSGIISNGTVNTVESIGSAYSDTLSVIDMAWFLVFLLMLVGTLYVGYFSPKINLLSMLSVLFFISMLVFYILGVYLDFTEWFRDEILLSILPTANTLLPLFNYYVSYLGIITITQLGLILLLNQIDFNLVKFNQRKDKELSTIQDNEVL